MIKNLNIIAFDIPYPANYGGAIDVFYRLKALHQEGVNIILHCFQYWREPAEELNKYCIEVHYYKRDTSLWAQMHQLPYTVIGRMNKELLKNLQANNYPILFEGLVSCGFLNHPSLKNRVKIFRECNIEHDYYNALGNATNTLWKKAYYKLEALKLKKFEQVLQHAQHIITLSHNDENYFKTQYPETKTHFIPCFHKHNDISSTPTNKEEKPFVLYHGNLMLPENEKSASYLCTNVFAKLNCKCVIAGMNPSRKLKELASKYRNIQLIGNPSEQEINKLIHDAHITILVTFQATGMKLKLINSIFSGKHIIANTAMLTGSGLESLCKHADDAETQIRFCNELLHTDFTDADIAMRKTVLYPDYFNQAQAQQLINIINNK
ncbi:MAG: glycosyltransferase [Bacteroidales bacterium]|nr:glycosyltransferase [Bacteroidales bacterium]